MNSVQALTYLKEQMKIPNISKRSGLTEWALKSYIAGNRNPGEYKLRLLGESMKEILSETNKML